MARHAQWRSTVCYIGNVHCQPRMGSWVTTAQHREPNSGKTENRWVSRSNSSAVPATEFMLNWYLRMWVYELASDQRYSWQCVRGVTAHLM